MPKKPVSMPAKTVDAVRKLASFLRFPISAWGFTRAMKGFKLSCSYIFINNQFFLPAFTTLNFMYGMYWATTFRFFLTLRAVAAFSNTGTSELTLHRLTLLGWVDRDLTEVRPGGFAISAILLSSNGLRDLTEVVDLGSHILGIFYESLEIKLILTQQEALTS